MRPSTREPAFAALLELAERAARSDASVLLTGESGTGKNLLARFLHEASPRREGPFVELPCANLPAELLEDELFGHEAGAFTDAREGRAGRFERANGGTLYLDEIGELRPETQAKLLRALDEKQFERLGGTRTIRVDVRIVASTREEPEHLVGQGRLREDLFYRLNVVRLRLPPLRERRADIRLLAGMFLEEAVARHRLRPKRLLPAAVEVLERYSWPGNIRQLRHVIEAAAVVSDGFEIGPEQLPHDLSLADSAAVRAAARSRMSLRELEEAYIEEVLRTTRGNKTAAARILGIARKTLHERLRARDRRRGGT
jgi:two-component system response regulator HydG